MSRLGATRIKLTSEDVMQFDDAHAASSQPARRILPEEVKVPGLFDPSKSFADNSILGNTSIPPRSRDSND